MLKAILADPDDDAARAVYADALAERGDPRGELIQLQLQVERLDLDDDARPPLLARADRLLHTYGPRWFFTARVSVRRGFVEKLAGDWALLRQGAAREPITAFSTSQHLTEPSPATLRLQELDIGTPASSAGDLMALRALCPKLRVLSARVELCDREVADAIDALALDGLTLGMSEQTDEALARILVAPKQAIGVGMPVGRIAALGVQLRASRILLAGFATADDLERVLGDARPERLTLGGGDEVLDWIAGWAGRASLRRLELRSATAATIERLARMRGIELRELWLHGDKRAGRLADPAAIARAPAFARLDALHISRLDLGQRALLELLATLPRLTTFSCEGRLPAERALVRRAPPRLVRIQGMDALSDRWPHYRTYAWA